MSVIIKVAFVDQDRKSKLDEVHYLIIRDEERKDLSKIPKIVMVHVHHDPPEGSDLDHMAVLTRRGGGLRRGKGLYQTALA